MDGPVLLTEYLSRNGLSLRDFAAKIEAPVALVWRWTRSGKSQPGIDYAFAIESATGGAIPVAAWMSRRPVRRDPGRSPGKPTNRRRKD